MYADPSRVGVVLVAAGAGQRLGRGVPKALVLCAGQTLLEHALDGIITAGVAQHICVVVPAGDTDLRAILTNRPPTDVKITVTDGGASRPESVRSGLAGLPEHLSIILVHDAARALTPPHVFHSVVTAVANGAPAVVPGIPVTDTIKTVSGTAVTGTPDRATLRAVQTPQGFEAATLRDAHSAADHPEKITDDAMLVESLGIPVTVAAGDPLAFKVTTPHDLMLAEALVLQAQEVSP